jgi:hypothetical protein
VRREVGDNFYLKVVRSGNHTTAYSPGAELSITAWYDLMKQTVRLIALPEPLRLLEAGEELYLASGQATLWVEAQPAFSKVDPLSPAAAENSPLSGTGLPVEHPKPAVDPQSFTFPLRQVNGIYAILNLGLSMVVGMQLYYLRFANESPLKWVTYIALLAPQIKAESGHYIRTSHY